jgi:hypothetical protein
VVPYVLWEQDRIIIYAFNDNIKPDLIKIVRSKSRIAPIGLPFIP